MMDHNHNLFSGQPEIYIYIHILITQICKFKFSENI